MGYLGNINLNIITPSGTCSIINLDNAGNSFGSGDLDAFTGDDLQGCLELPVPDHQVDYIIVNHSGSDGWLLDYITLRLTDGRVLQCDYYDWLDGNDNVSITCRSP
jgi:hypothetical protein